MPFDGSGNFTRNYNWTDDKLAGIKIESERMDGEFDNFAAGMNQVMLRNGAIPWTGDLKLNGNKIVGLADGTAPSPALSFLSDTTTGIFLQSPGNFSISASGVERMRVSSQGAVIYGNVWSAGITANAPALWAMNGDANSSSLVWDSTPGAASFLQWDIVNKKLNYVVSGVNKAYFDASGGFHTNGDITAGHITGTGIDVPANTFSGASLVDGTVTTSKLADGAVTNAKVADNTLTPSKWHSGEWFIASNGGGFGLYKGSMAGTQSRVIMGLFNNETGANVGSDFFINVNDDTGNFIATPITIARKTGLVSIQNGLQCVAPANFSSSIVAQGSIQTKGQLFFGPNTDQNLNADANSTIFNVNVSNCYIQYIKASGVFNFVVNGVVNGFINNAGEVHARSWLVGTNFGTPDGIMQLVHTNNAANGTLYFDTRTNQTYISWDGNTLWFNAAGATPMYLTSTAASFNVNLACTRQGFFTGNLNAAQNNGVASNCVIVGFFQSGAYYNANVLGINTAANTGIMGYNGGAANAFWSTSPSDRRLKENIERPSRDALDVVRNLPVWSCDYVPPKVNRDAVEDPDAWPEVREHWAFSFMADEVEAALPNATVKHEGASVALHPNHLIATLWAAVQQLTDRLESAEATIKTLKGTHH